MFKNISVKKARIITAIICTLIGVIYCVGICFTYDDTFDKLVGIFLGIFISFFLYSIIDLVVFTKRKYLEDSISYAKNVLSKEEYRKVNLKLVYNEFVNLSVEESRISYYAKIKSDKEIEISIRKDEKEISSKIIDLFSFKRFFAN